MNVSDHPQSTHEHYLQLRWGGGCVGWGGKGGSMDVRGLERVRHPQTLPLFHPPGHQPSFIFHVPCRLC